jgi:hypothetical protein
MTELAEHIAAHAQARRAMKPHADALRGLRKEAKTHLDFFKTYMQDNDLTKLEIGDEEVFLTTQHAVKFTEARLLDFLDDPHTVEAYKNEYGAQQQRMSVKKRKIT